MYANSYDVNCTSQREGIRGKDDFSVCGFQTRGAMKKGFCAAKYPTIWSTEIYRFSLFVDFRVRRESVPLFRSSGAAQTRQVCVHALAVQRYTPISAAYYHHWSHRLKLCYDIHVWRLYHLHMKFSVLNQVTGGTL